LECPEELPTCGTSGNTLRAAEVIAEPTVTYAWTLTGTNWYIESGADTEEITYHAGDPGTMGTFTLVITDGCGCQTSCTIDCECESGGYCTYTMGGWGSTCPDPQVSDMMSTQPGCIRDHYFADVYGSGGVWIGDPDHHDGDGYYAAKWTTAAAVRDFLPAGSKPMPLGADRTNMATDDGNVLVSQILALHLNVEYSCAGIFDLLGLLPQGVMCYSGLDVPTECLNGKFDPMTVGEFLALADRAVSGEDVLPAGVNASHVNFTATCLNEYFDECRPPMPTPVAPDMEPPTDPIVRPSEGVEIALPEQFEFTGFYPNPANATTTVLFALPVESMVTINVYDIKGRRVRTLMARQVPAGYHSVVWNGKDAQGKAVAPGVYFCRVGFSDHGETMKKLIKLE
jgi:hypothetical protein